MLEEVIQLSPATILLESLYLDPNNPRFSEDGRPRVSDEQIDQESLQSELMAKMEREHAVDRLKDSMEANGYVPIDRIVVRRFKDDKYVVLEGNRRITAAKRLLSLHQEGRKELNPIVVESLHEIPALVYTGVDADAAWVFQGLRHISGIKDWSAFNKSKLLVDQMQEQDLSLTDAGKIFGISAWQAGQWVRAYYAYRQISEHPDYHRDLDTRVFPTLQELFGRSNVSLKDWLGWNDAENRFENEDRFDEFLSWLYPKVNDQGEFDPDIAGDWDNRRIPRALDLRGLSDLLAKHPDEFQKFRLGGSLDRAVGRAAAKEEEEAETADYYLNRLDEIIDEVEKLPYLLILEEGKQDDVSEKVQRLLSKLERAQKLLS